MVIFGGLEIYSNNLVWTLKWLSSLWYRSFLYSKTSIFSSCCFATKVNIIATTDSFAWNRDTKDIKLSWTSDVCEKHTWTNQLAKWNPLFTLLLLWCNVFFFANSWWFLLFHHWSIVALGSGNSLEFLQNDHKRLRSLKAIAWIFVFHGII